MKGEAEFGEQSSSYWAAFAGLVVKAEDYCTHDKSTSGL
jgi:hypothetical protein